MLLPEGIHTIRHEIDYGDHAPVEFIGVFVEQRLRKPLQEAANANLRMLVVRIVARTMVVFTDNWMPLAALFCANHKTRIALFAGECAFVLSVHNPKY